MDDTDKIVAAILAAGLCATAGSADMDDYIANYRAIAERLPERKAMPSPKGRPVTRKKNKRRA